MTDSLAGQVSHLFWPEWLWLPPGYHWSDYEKGGKPRFGDLYYSVFSALALFAVRKLLEKVLFAPLGRALGIKEARPSTQLSAAELRLERALAAGGDARADTRALAKKLELGERQVERLLRRRAQRGRPGTLARFAECAWRMSFYACAFAYGLFFVLWEAPWLWDSMACFRGYPHHAVTAGEWWYYQLELGFYLSLLVSQFWDTRRKDFGQMLVHHLATVALMVFSWACCLQRIGTLVLVIHDFADVPLEAVKLARYSRAPEGATNAIFVLFALSWIFSRLGLLPWRVIAYSTYYALREVPMFPAYYVFNALLLVLQALHIVWTWLILRMAYNAIYQDGVKDIRESDESGLDSSSAATATTTRPTREQSPLLPPREKINVQLMMRSRSSGFLVSALLCCVAASLANGEYSGDKHVKLVTSSGQLDTILSSSKPVLVQFFAPWCGHCKRFKETYSKAARALATAAGVQVVAVDGDQAKDLMGREGVQGFPTVRLYLAPGSGSGKFKEYSGSRDSATAVTDFVLDTLKAEARKQLGGSSSSGSGGGGQVVELTDANFGAKTASGVWLVEFFAPWCGHCKQLEPVYRQLAARAVAQAQGVKGFPTIKLFKEGRHVEDYQGPRDLASLLDYVRSHRPPQLVPSTLRQLTAQADLDQCLGSDGSKSAPLCVLAWLPHLLDCDAACRRGYLRLLETEAADLVGLEELLGLGPGIGYPSLAVVNGKRAKTAPLRGSFGNPGLRDFLRNLVYGRQAVYPLSAAAKDFRLSSTHSLRPWDGLDFKDDGSTETEETMQQEEEDKKKDEL
ncbi:Ceramide synthase 6 [Halotydeus destructor]|nr:Ceramide synthase 6 [Halotydeus destructor]